MKLDTHHRFAKHQNRKRRYGDLINHPVNMERLDHDRHMSGRVSHLNEREFCRAAGVLKCEYCENYLAGHDTPCLKYYGVTAEDCREFLFDYSKYSIDK